MDFSMLKRLGRLFLLGLLVLCMSLGSGVISPAYAVISSQKEDGMTMLYQSRQSLGDSGGNPWQVVFFKRVKSGKSPVFNLRLVGFPGVGEFVHPSNLKMMTISGELFEFKDLFSGESPSPNVGQYEINLPLSQIQNNDSIILYLPLKNAANISLTISPTVVQEWKKVQDLRT
ncbi:MAG: hypothetical protein RLZZ338_3221 [Cyanobacteriota bacterium]|jgi:hypothetical protein